MLGQMVQLNARNPIFAACVVPFHSALPVCVSPVPEVLVEVGGGRWCPGWETIPQGPAAWVTGEGRRSLSQTGALSTPLHPAILCSCFKAPFCLLHEARPALPSRPVRSPPKPMPLCLASPRSPNPLLLFLECRVFLSLSTLQVSETHLARGPLGPPYLPIVWAGPSAHPGARRSGYSGEGLPGSCWGAAESRNACFVGLPDLAIK